jgi:hypothetical protein
MWTCECGEFNNDDASFCVACKKVRIADKDKESMKEIVHETENMFRKIQEFILLDIAMLCVVAVVSFVVAMYTELEQDYKTIIYIGLFIVIILFQLMLVIGMLRMFYSSAVNAERNTFFLQKIYQLMKEEEEKADKEETGPRPRY